MDTERLLYSLIITALLLLGAHLCAQGQCPDCLYQWGRNKGSQVWPLEPSPSVKYVHRLDTVPVWRVVVDTSDRVGVSYPTGRPARVIKLLEVREWHNEREDNRFWADCVNCEYYDYPKHLGYLLRSHLRLPFSWLVLETMVLPEAEAEVEPAPIIERDPEGPPDSLLKKWRELSGDTSAVIYGTGVNLSHIDSVVGFPSFQTFTQSRDKPGPGIREWSDLKDRTLMGLDWIWMPRRLAKRFKKFYHIKP